VLIETRSATVPLRRVGDLLVLLPAAPVVVPLIGLLALVVKFDSPGPALVRVTRLGQHGRPFELLKLRSMTTDADSVFYSAALLPQPFETLTQFNWSTA
jgi:lipopolysaccharide/colanic/teichoic acid biosynthesis glycosyltransferase